MRLALASPKIPDLGLDQFLALGQRANHRDGKHTFHSGRSRLNAVTGPRCSMVTASIRTTISSSNPSSWATVADMWASIRNFDQVRWVPNLRLARSTAATRGSGCRGRTPSSWSGCSVMTTRTVPTPFLVGGLDLQLLLGPVHVLRDLEAMLTVTPSGDSCCGVHLGHRSRGVLDRRVQSRVLGGLDTSSRAWRSI